MNRQRLTSFQARRLIDKLAEHVSKKDGDQLEKILTLYLDDETDISLGLCLAKIVPDKDEKDALAAFTSLRSRVKKAAKAARVEFEVCVDTAKRTSPDKRLTWIEGESDAIERALAKQRMEFANLPTETFVPPRAYPTTQQAQEDGKRTVLFFFSAHRDDRKDAEDIRERIQEHFRAAKNYDYRMWGPDDILVGQDKATEIERALKKADFGFLVVSRKYISKLEPYSLGIKPLIPVALDPLSSEKYDLKGLENLQLFTWHDKSFRQCRDKQEKEAFITALFEEIEGRLESGGFEWEPPDLTVLYDSEGELLEESFVPPRAWEGDPKDATERKEEELISQGKDALALIHDWAINQRGSEWCAVLGEVGIGKTTALRLFCHQLDELRQEDPSLPIPIYIDLRHYSEAIQKGGSLVDAETLLNEMLKASWRSRGEEAQLTAKEALHLVRNEGAILVYDGLDEKLVHLNQEQGKELIRGMWSALPPQSLRRSSPYERRGKIILSCRSHYFPDVGRQRSLFHGEDREHLRRDQYLMLIMLPFNEEQIRSYLAKEIGEERVEETLSLFASIHNLTDLSRRPYLLWLITQELGRLEKMRSEGKRVQGVTLYELVVERWFARDDGKHSFDALDKGRLMQALALAMWQDDAAREWPWEKVRGWLLKEIARNELLKLRYLTGAKAKDPEVLEEDFRTATLVLRPDSSKQAFRFAHTSLQEFFLAMALLEELTEGNLEVLNMPMPSLETLDFLAQLIETSSKLSNALETLTKSLQRGGEPAKIALRYGCLANEKQLPSPDGEHADLRDMDLKGWCIRGPWNLEQADWRGACLREARLHKLDLRGSQFDGVDGRYAHWVGVRLNGSQLGNADFSGTRFEKCDAQLAEGTLATWYSASIVHSQTDGLALPVDFTKTGFLSGVRNNIPANASGFTAARSDEGHSDSVLSVAFSQDGSQLLSGSSDNSLKLWGAHTGECLRNYKGHSESVRSGAFSPDGTQILSGSDDHSLKLWDVYTGQCLRTFHGHSNSVWSVAFSPDGQQLLSGSDDKSLRLWDTHTGECLRIFRGHLHWVRNVAFSPDGTQLLSGSDDKSLKLWDAHSGKCLRTFRGHSNSVWSVAFSPDGKHLLSGSSDKTLKLWGTRAGKCLCTFKGHSFRLRSVAFSPDGKHLLSGSWDKTLKLWDAHTGECLRTFHGHSEAVWGVGFSPDGKQLLSGSSDKSLKLWDTQSGECLRTLQGHSESVWSVAISPNGKQLLSGSDDKSLKLWDTQSDECLRIFQGHSESVWSVAFSPNGKQLLSGSDDKSLKLWDTQSGQCLRSFHGHSGPVRSVAFSRDGKQLLSGSDDKSLKLWNTQSGECLRSFHGHSEPVRSVAFSPNRKQLLSGSNDRSLRLWDTRSGECLRTFQGNPKNSMWSVAFSPDGRQLLSGSDDKSLKLWDAQSGQCLRTLEGHSNAVLSVKISPDGKQLLSGSSDSSLKLWDAHTGECQHTFEGHSNSVWSVAFSPDGKQLLSGSSDKSLRLWDVETGKCLRTFMLGPDHESATIDETNNRVLWHSPGAWKFLGWRWWDPDAERLRMLPLEHCL